MEKGSEKLQAILDAAKTLFWKHGIKRVTLEEICQEAGVSKMTCYKYFSNKTALACYMIEGFFDTSLNSYREILNSNIPYDEKVIRTMELKMSNAHNLSQEMIDDIYKDKNTEIYKVMESVKDRLLEFYLDDFRNAQKRGEIRSDIKPEFIIYFINQLTVMITDEKLVSLYPDPKHMIAEITSFFFYGILPRKISKANVVHQD